MLAARSVNDLIGRSIVDFIHPDDRNRVLNRVDHLMKAEGNTYGLVEVRYIRFDGAEIDVEATGVGILYGDEHAVQVIIRDTTARKESERKLAEEKEKLKSLLNNAQDAVNIMDLDGKILRVNPAWEAMYGWTQEEVVGKPTPTVSHERFNNGWNRLVERIMRGETIPLMKSRYSVRGRTVICLYLHLSNLRRGWQSCCRGGEHKRYYSTQRNRAEIAGE